MFNIEITNTSTTISIKTNQQKKQIHKQTKNKSTKKRTKQINNQQTPESSKLY